uniref:CAZy families GT2 protein n=1 Tax=uncultured Stenotrophomonas sp. TaxID=165438 RepID=A0A060CHV3_9GAMM|nr:CAZy families GT2 protein [uncultured Stenotrophomonas sp.]
MALFAWIVQAFVGAVAGFVLIVSKRRPRLGLSAKAPLPVLSSRTALLMPTYNEDPERLLAGLQAIHESLAATGQLFDVRFLRAQRYPQAGSPGGGGSRVPCPARTPGR